MLGLPCQTLICNMRMLNIAIFALGSSVERSCLLPNYRAKPWQHLQIWAEASPLQPVNRHDRGARLTQVTHQGYCGLLIVWTWYIEAQRTSECNTSQIHSLTSIELNIIRKLAHHVYC